MQSKKVSSQHVTDEVLVGRALKGDQRASEELVLRCRGMCLDVATTILRNRTEAQDEVQNALCKAFKQLAQFSNDSKFSTWVTRIVINQCLMRYRRNKRELFVSYSSLPTRGSDRRDYYEPADPRTPEQGLGGDEIKELVRSELGRLPGLLRSPLEMRFLQDLSLEETAARLGISVPAVKSRLHRAQQYMRRRMLRHCPGRGAASIMKAA